MHSTARRTYGQTTVTCSRPLCDLHVAANIAAAAAAAADTRHDALSLDAGVVLIPH